MNWVEKQDEESWTLGNDLIITYGWPIENRYTLRWCDGFNWNMVGDYCSLEQAQSAGNVIIEVWTETS